MTVFDPTGTDAHTLGNSRGMAVTILGYGAIIQSIVVPDRDGLLANVVLGFDRFSEYVEKSPYFGAVVGRYANRIAGGAFRLGGVDYQVPVNNGPNSLHGGIEGFDRQHWTTSGSDGSSITLRHSSADGDQGYPGNLAVSITYTLTEANQLQLEYTATTDAATVVNLSNHAYFNLGGEGSGSILDHVTQLNAGYFLPVDASLIPTGEVAPVAGTPFDFTNPKVIGRNIRDGRDIQIGYGRGYDHTFVLDGWSADSSDLAVAAVITDPGSGRRLTVSTDQPGVQFYTGNFLDGTCTGSSGRVYRQGDGLCLETQHFPNSPNQPRFPTTELEPGDMFRSKTIFGFSAE
ncbi:MAG: aldose epimerase family protein [Thermomicrobiales bacterium]